MLQQLRRRYTLHGITLETALQEIDARVAELIGAGELWRVALRNVVHDGPFVVHGGPWSATSCHFEDNAAERPHVDGAVAARGTATNHFGGHVHGRAGHGALATLAGVGGDGAALAGDEFGGAEVDVFDYTVVVEEDVCEELV
jgi:hypothetical protein